MSGQIEARAIILTAFVLVMMKGAMDVRGGRIKRGGEGEWEQLLESENVRLWVEARTREEIKFYGAVVDWEAARNTREKREN